jgi:hypothetical protein
MADQISAGFDENCAMRDFPAMKMEFRLATELMLARLAAPPVEAICVMIPIVGIVVEAAIMIVTAMIEGEQVVEPMVVIKSMIAIGVVICPMAVGTIAIIPVIPIETMLAIGAMVLVKPTISIRAMLPIKPIDIG